MNLRLPDLCHTLQEVEIAAAVGLSDVFHHILENIELTRFVESDSGCAGGDFNPLLTLLINDCGAPVQDNGWERQ